MNALLERKDMWNGWSRHRIGPFLYLGPASECTRYFNLIKEKYPKMNLEIHPIMDSTGLTLEVTDKILELENNPSFVEGFERICKQAKKIGKTKVVNWKKALYINHMLCERFHIAYDWDYLDYKERCPIVCYFLNEYFIEYENGIPDNIPLELYPILDETKKFMEALDSIA